MFVHNSESKDRQSIIFIEDEIIEYGSMLDIITLIVDVYRAPAGNSTV